MANQFTVTTAQLNQKAGELRSNNRNLTTQIENLRSQHSALNGIENYVTKLTEIAKTYEQAEAKNVELGHVRTYK